MAGIIGGDNPPRAPELNRRSTGIVGGFTVPGEQPFHPHQGDHGSGIFNHPSTNRATASSFRQRHTDAGVVPRGPFDRGIGGPKGVRGGPPQAS